MQKEKLQYIDIPLPGGPLLFGRDQSQQWVAVKKRASLINNDKQMIYTLSSASSMVFIRDNPDPQLAGDMFIPEKDFEISNREPCKFCGHLYCAFFYFRDSFYRMIEYSILFSIEKRLDSHWFAIQNTEDIFMPSKNAPLGTQFSLPQIMHQKSFELIRVLFDDWFSYQLYYQLEHEVQVRDYVLKNNLKEIVVNGRTHKISKDSFGINLNLSELYVPCQICPPGNICNYKLYTARLKYVGLLSKRIIKDPKFKDHEQMLDAANWSQDPTTKVWQFTYGKFKGQLQDNVLPNCINFIEHIKAYSEKLLEPQDQKEPLLKCQICLKFADKKCSACKSVSYCSTEHQKLAWPLHKLQCKKLSMDQNDQGSNDIGFKQNFKLMQQDQSQKLVCAANPILHQMQFGGIWNETQKRSKVLNNNKQQVYSLINNPTVSFIRNYPDPQIKGEIYISEKEQIQSQTVRCKFCNEIGCFLFYFRDSYYRMIEYCILSSVESRIQTPWQCIQNTDDIFQCSINAPSSTFDLASEIYQKNPVQRNYDDWFTRSGLHQLRHEEKVRLYVLTHNLQEIEVNGTTHKISKDSFGIKLNLLETYGACRVCTPPIVCNYKLYISRLKIAFQISKKLISDQSFEDHAQLLVAQNWSQDKKTFQWTFNYQKFTGTLTDKILPFSSNFILHIKAYSDQQLIQKNNIPSSKCNVCFKIGDKNCGKCKQINYCSVEHQKLDWPNHKLVCSQQSLKIDPVDQKNNKLIQNQQNLQLLDSSKKQQVSSEIEESTAKEIINSVLEQNDQNLNQKQVVSEAMFQDLSEKQKLILEFDAALTPGNSNQNFSTNEKNQSVEIDEELKEPQETNHVKKSSEENITSFSLQELKNLSEQNLQKELALKNRISELETNLDKHQSIQQNLKQTNGSQKLKF